MSKGHLSREINSSSFTLPLESGHANKWTGLKNPLFAVGRIWHIQDNQSQIPALAFR